MTRTHTAKIEIRRWKAHVCIGCGCRYAYSIVRKKAYGGSTPERATEKAEAAAQRAITREIDRQPCPDCGLYQPDMVAAERRKSQIVLLLASVLSCSVLAALGLANVVPANRMLLMGMTAAAVIGGLSFLFGLRNPNRHLEANRTKAQQAVAARRMKIMKPGGELPPGFRLPQERKHGVLAAALVGASIIAFACPEMLRRQLHWPLNENAFPPVVGPGDATRVFLPQAVESIKGYWKGISRVEAKLADDPQSERYLLPSSTGVADWGNSIPVRQGESADRQRLWVRFELPPDLPVAGKKLLCTVYLMVQYPERQDSKVFKPHIETFFNNIELAVASPFAGRRYMRWCWSGFGGGAALLLASIFLRLLAARAMSRAASRGELVEE